MAVVVIWFKFFSSHLVIFCVRGWGYTASHLKPDVLLLLRLTNDASDRPYSVGYTDASQLGSVAALNHQIFTIAIIFRIIIKFGAF